MFESLRAHHSAVMEIKEAEEAIARGELQLADDLRKTAVLHERKSVELSRKARAITLRAQRAKRRAAKAGAQ